MYSKSSIVPIRLPDKLIHSIEHSPEKYARSATIAYKLIQAGIDGVSICDDRPGCVCVRWDSISASACGDFADALGLRIFVDGDRNRIVIG